MVTLRSFTAQDAPLLLSNSVAASLPDAQQRITAWSAKQHNGRYFEMLGVFRADTLVGTLSLCAQSPNIASLGIEIFALYQRQGCGKAAMRLGMEMARQAGFSILSDQIRQDNAASLALHRALGFETDGYVYRNRRDHPVLIYLRSLK